MLELEQHGDGQRSLGGGGGSSVGLLDVSVTRSIVFFHMMIWRTVVMLALLKSPPKIKATHLQVLGGMYIATMTTMVNSQGNRMVCILQILTKFPQGNGLAP